MMRHNVTPTPMVENLTWESLVELVSVCGSLTRPQIDSLTAHMEGNRTMLLARAVYEGKITERAGKFYPSDNKNLQRASVRRAVPWHGYALSWEPKTSFDGKAVPVPYAVYFRCWAFEESAAHTLLAKAAFSKGYGLGGIREVQLDMERLAKMARIV